MTTENNISQEIYVVETPQCGICNKFGVVEIPFLGYLQWSMGVIIQEALPNLSPELREQLKTGIHPECYKEMTGG